ncbi:protoheme IX farnesyltransferase [Halobacteriales archaeon QS_1_68_20]|nr:MAG: protoheme IX farnesyltransferase [Halobacteriales archaeon QS_1_68_20]
MLAGVAVGVYLLVIAGATAAIADAAAACGAWPLCGGASPTDPSVAVALGHRAVAAVVGLLLVGTVAVAWARNAPRRVRAALAGAALLYPVQIAVGALAAVKAVPPTLAGTHLAVGVTIFVGVALALAWQLEAETADGDDPLAATGVTTVADPPEVAATPAEDDAAVGGSPADAAGSAGLLATARAYVRLTKPRLMWLLCLVAAAAMALAAGPALSARTVGYTLLGGVLAIGASGTFNHVLERDVDRRMQRTADRPLATDQVGVRNAVGFGVVLSAAAVASFLQVNALAAGLGLVAILFYSVVYTLVLKPHTVQNTVIGGFAGSLPALIGWAAVTGRVGVPAVVLAGLIFLWTPAHFYNLAMAHREDYARGGFPMLPVVHGPAVARRHVLLYLVATMVAAAALAAVSRLGVLYAGTAVVLGTGFLWAVLRLHRERTEAAAMRAFHASNAFLGGLLVVVVLDALLLA